MPYHNSMFDISAHCFGCFLSKFYFGCVNVWSDCLTADPVNLQDSTLTEETWKSHFRRQFMTLLLQRWWFLMIYYAATAKLVIFYDYFWRCCCCKDDDDKPKFYWISAFLFGFHPCVYIWICPPHHGPQDPMSYFLGCLDFALSLYRWFWHIHCGWRVSWRWW